MKQNVQGRPSAWPKANMIRFSSKAGADVTMFEKPARLLIRYMGHSGTVPSAILAEDLDVALKALLNHLQRLEEGDNAGAAAPRDDEDEAPPISLRTRAYPLIKLLETARDRQEAITWDVFTGTLI